MTTLFQQYDGFECCCLVHGPNSQMVVRTALLC
jgi:hypothetical protein